MRSATLANAMRKLICLLPRCRLHPVMRPLFLKRCLCCCRPRESGDPVSQGTCCEARAYCSLGDYWVPAFAGTTPNKHSQFISISLHQMLRSGRELLGRAHDPLDDLLHLLAVDGRDLEACLGGISQE